MLVYSVKNFNSHASCEAWRQQNTVKIRECPISTHTPHARRDRRAGWMQAVSVISTHTPHARRDPFIFLSASSEYNFNSHASCEAWHYVKRWFPELCDFNSHASCEAWRRRKGMIYEMSTISTHTPHARRDLLTALRGMTYLYFNSHASCEAWPNSISFRTMDGNISTHTPHARRDAIQSIIAKRLTISTHTPHARRDRPVDILQLILNISTHTPHARRDFMVSDKCCYYLNFNSHASCEAWPEKVLLLNTYAEFQLTRLMRGVTSLTVWE